MDISPTDSRSETNILTLHKSVQPLARALVHGALAIAITIKVLSGNRTYAEQDLIFAQGRTRGGVRVTNARGGQSNHNFGLAFDIGIFSGGAYIEESPLYAKVGALGKSIGLSWGGDWHSGADEPHFELRPYWAATLGENEMLAQLRDRHDRGKDAFA